MDESLIRKYIDKTASQSEKEQVLEWASLSAENKRELIEAINLYVSDNMPQDEVSDAKYLEFEHYMRGYNASEAKERHAKRINIFAWCSAAAVILFLVGWNLFLANEAKSGPNAADSITVAENMVANLSGNMRELYTDKGVKARIILPDSSEVWLNSDTKIEYPEFFDKSSRQVKLSGEAYFNVKSDSSWPMIITTPQGFQVKVTGTSFNLKAHEDDHIAKATLYSGKISLLYKDAEDNVVEEVIKPNESVDIVAGKVHSKVTDDIEKIEAASVWKAGKIYFEDTPIKEALKVLNRWHGSEFVVQSADVLDYRITANFENESIVQIMELIKLTTYIDYSIDGNKITLKKR